MNHTDLVALDYDVNGTGPLLVAIHGLNENRDSWDTIDVVLGMWAPLLEMSPAEFVKWSAGTTAVPATVPYLALHGRHPGPEYDAWLHQAVPSAKLEARDIDTHYVDLADPDWFVARLVAIDATTKDAGA